MLKHILRFLLATPFVIAAIMAVVLATTAPKQPPIIEAVEKANTPFAAYAKEVPPYQYLTARDGEKLAYHYYQGLPGKGVAVVIHGSSGTALAAHGVAKALQARGITVYAPDLRGHGKSKGYQGKLGDIAYVGQYQDDIADFSTLITARHKGEKRLLIGHSMGGAMILGTAHPSRAQAFDTYLALSPFIAPNTPMDRPDEGGWTTVSIPRFVILSILNGFGITQFNHLKVLGMAVEKNNQDRPRSYSYALTQSANLPREWKPAVAAIKAPTEILIGADDELFFADQYPKEIGAVNPSIPVTLIPKTGHMDIMFSDAALKVVADHAEARLKH